MRVVEDEALTDETRVVVERRAIDESIALGVDEEPGPVGPVEHVVPFARARLPGKRIAQAGAATGFDADSEAAVGQAVTEGHLPDELPRVLADLDHIALKIKRFEDAQTGLLETRTITVVF